MEKYTRNHHADVSFLKTQNCSVILKNVQFSRFHEQLGQKPSDKNEPPKSTIDVRMAKVVIKKMKPNDLSFYMMKSNVIPTKLNETIGSQPDKEGTGCPFMPYVNSYKPNQSNGSISSQSGDEWHLCVSATSEEASPAKLKNLE